MRRAAETAGHHPAPRLAAARPRAQTGRRLARIVLAIAALPAGCGSPQNPPAPHARLVDHVAGASAPTTPPTETIGNQTRPVLRAYPSRTITFGARVDALESGRIWHRQRLPGPLAVERLVVVTRTSGFFDKPAKRRWSAATARLLRPVRGEGGPFVEIPVDLEVASEPEAGSPAVSFALRADARVPPPPLERIETGPVELPGGAELRFGVGVLEEASGQGPVRFSVEICQQGGCEAAFSETLDPAAPEGGGWQDRRVSLAPWAGQTVRLRFDARHVGASPDSFSFPLWSDPTLYAPRRARAVGPNLLLVSLDTLRADHLTSYGYARNTSPFIESELQRGGLLFERAFTSATTTAPSHMTMFTSLQPSVHGIVRNDEVQPLSEGATTLAESLRRHGFETGAVTENAAIARNRGFERGFGSYVETQTSAWPKGEMTETLARGRAWLDANAERRFFLFLHTYQVHYPYQPPDAYAHLFPEPVPGRELPPGLPARSHPDSYDREIRYTDDLLKDFFHRLEADGLLENTLVVITSDHGEGFLEHGYLAHGAGLHEEILHVPLLFWGPGVAGGRRVTAPVGLVDLMPTLLDLLGVPPVAGMMGRSFAHLVAGEGADATWDARPHFSEAWREMRVEADAAGRLRWVAVERPNFAVRVGGRKLIRYRQGDGYRYSYYDLSRDPGEVRDRYAEDPRAADDLRALLEEYTRTTADLKADLDRSGESGTTALDPEREERLRSLGYIQ